MGQRDSRPVREILKTLEEGRGSVSDIEEGLLGSYDGHLDLSGKPVTDKDARKLADLLRRGGYPSVSLLDLGNCSLSATGLQYIARGLYNSPITPTITRVNLSTRSMPPRGNSIGNGGAKSLAQLIERCPTLREVHASCCDIESEGAMTIASALTRTLSLRILNLSYNRIRDQGAYQIGLALKTNHSLHGLSLWSNGILSTGVEGLAEGLATNNTLKWLGLGCNNIGNDGAFALSEGLLKNTTRSKLTWLALGNNHISDEGAEHLAELLAFGLTDIDQESDSDDGYEEANSSYAVCPLQSLGLGGNNIGDLGASALATALEDNTRLTSLGLSHNRIGEEGALELADSLRINRSLHSLILSHNEIGTNGAETLVASLTQNRTLKALYLASNNLQDSVCERCAEVLCRHNFSLRTIDLHNNSMSGSALRKLLSHVETRQIPVKVLTGPLPSFTPFESEEAIPIRSSGHLSMLPNWQQTHYPARTLFQGMLPAERASYTLSSLPPPAHPPHPQHGRRWRQAFNEDPEEDDFTSDDSYSSSSEESTDSIERPVQSSNKREPHMHRSTKAEAKPQTSIIRVNPLFSGTLVEGSTLSEVIAEPEEEASDVMPLASIETKQQQNKGVRRFSKSTKKEGVYNVEASYHHSIGGRRSSKLGVVELRPIREVDLVSSRPPVDAPLLVETVFDDDDGVESATSSEQSSASSLELEVVTGKPLLPNLTKNRVKPPIGRKTPTKLSPSSSTLSAPVAAQEWDHAPSLRQAHKSIHQEPAKLSNQKHSSKVPLQLEITPAPKEMIERKRRQERRHSSHIHPPVLQQQQQQQQTRPKIQLTIQENQQPKEAEENETTRPEVLQQPIKHNRHMPKKDVTLQLPSEEDTDRNQSRAEILVVQEEPYQQHKQKQKETHQKTRTKPTPAEMWSSERELSEQWIQHEEQQLQSQEQQQHKREEQRQQQEQEERYQQCLQREKELEENQQFQQQQQQRKQSQKQKQQLEQQQHRQDPKETIVQQLQQQQHKWKQKQLEKRGKQQQQLEKRGKQQQQQRVKKQLLQQQHTEDNHQKPEDETTQPPGQVTGNRLQEHPIHNLKPEKQPKVASTSLQSGGAPSVPEQAEGPPTFSPPLSVAAVVQTTDLGSNMDVNTQQYEEEVPELEPISLDEIIGHEQEEQQAQLTDRNQQSLIIGAPETLAGMDSKLLREQWLTGLTRRVGMVKMGGFLHKGFDSVNASVHQHDLSIASLPCNKIRHREGSSLPPNHTRVRLQVVMEDLGSDYINASFVGSPSYPKSYIITQRPMENTVPDFWRMVWEQHVSVVVVLSSQNEGIFWPLEGQYELHPLVVSGEWSYNALHVSREEAQPTEAILGLEKISLTLQSSIDSETKQHVQLLHYPAWPQNGVPQNVMAGANVFHHAMNGQLPMAVKPPMIVVSDQGAGRAGCFCAVAIAYELIRTAEECNPVPFDDDSNILDSVIRGIRSQRPGLVANQRQFDFCHHVLHEILWGKRPGEEVVDGEKKGRWKLFGKKNANPDKKPKEKQKSQRTGKQKGKKLSAKKKAKLPENVTPEDLTTLLF